MMLMLPIMYAIVILFHIVVFIVQVLIYPLLIYLMYQTGKSMVGEIANSVAAVTNLVPQVALAVTHGLMAALYVAAGITLVYIFTQVPKIQAYFKTFSIPNYTYPNCDMCVCKPEEQSDTSELDSKNTKAPSGTKEKNQTPVNKDGSNLLSQIGQNIFYNPDNLAESTLYAGAGIPFDGDIGCGVGTGGNCVPVNSISTGCENERSLPEFIDTFKEDGDTKSKGTAKFSAVLPLPDMVNLFNLKQKYFSNTVPNNNFNTSIAGNVGGKGTNQIKVTFNTDNNIPNTFYHLDNVVALVVGPDQGAALKEGQLITFQDLKQSKDVNITTFPENEYGTTSITGTSFFADAPLKQVTVKYADWNSPTNEKSVNYFIKGKIEDSSYLKFPMDVEYYQIIYSKPFTTFQTDQGNTLQNSFYSRYLFNGNNYIGNSFKYPYTDPTNDELNCNQGTIEPRDPQFKLFADYAQQYVVFLVRGVDPQSTKQKNRYDISKLMGYKDWGSKVVEFNGFLNVPIQKGYKSVKHDIANNNTTDPWSGNKLFYNSYSFLPTVSEMKEFNTPLTKYYSSLSNLTGSWGNNGVYGGYRFNCSGGYCTHVGVYPFGTVNQPNYYPNESLEGGSSLYYRLTTANSPGHFEFSFAGIDYDENCRGECKYNKTFCESGYDGGIYTNDVKILKSTDFNNNRIVMRSDRLPSSTSTYVPNPACGGPNVSNRFLMANPIFSVYALEDDGSVNSSIPPNSVPTNGEGDLPKTLETFSCDKLVPLECYKYDNVNGKKILTVRDPNDPNDNSCYTNKLGSKKKIMRNGCYVLVTTPFLSIARDFYLISEWNSRFVLNYAACQNVFSHVFTNNWVNGSLYMFSIVNQRVFDNKNKATARYCNRVVYLDANEVTTENGNVTSYSYYYRSAPYVNGNFYGQKSVGEPSQTNKFNLNFPTTIMDLGPRDLFTQEVILSDEYDGYILNTLDSTTFKDTSSILTYFITSRLTSKGFLNSVGSATLAFYFSRKNSFIDGDVAQLIATNSQYGIAPYDSAYYGDDDAFINNPEGDTVIGIFFTGNTQNRDFISPKRTIYYDSGSITDSSSCGLSVIPSKTQTVPFYQWNIKDASASADQSIFGSQTNEWATDFNPFFSYDYQKLDRLLPSSRYFRTNKSVLTKDFNGNIYSIDGNTRVLQAGLSTWSKNTDPIDKILLGAPYYFYFGLKKGKTSFDKFVQVWLDVATVD